jgi:hypothetical protein
MNRDNEHIPSWTGLNILARSHKSISENKIEYLQFINSPAMNMDIEYAILVQSIKICDKLDLDEVPCCLLLLYAKASEIVWKIAERFKKIIPTMGPFHAMRNQLGTMVKRFIYAGLRDLAEEAGSIVDGSVDAAL